MGSRFASILLILFVLPRLHSQSVTGASAIFDFNEHNFEEKHGKTKTQPIGVSLVKDRFGNERSALYLHGHLNSYMILGNSDIMKPRMGTISLWANIERKVEAGKGYNSNPIIFTRGTDNVRGFYDGYVMFYDIQSKRMMVFFSKDSTEQAGINSLDSMPFSKWEHYVFTWNDHHAEFYIDGILQDTAGKNFPTRFLKDAPVYIGHSGSTVNDRRMRGMVDDIRFYPRMLSSTEIMALYEEPNPNRTVLILAGVLKYGSMAAGVAGLSYLLVWRRRVALKKEQERYVLINRLHDLEIRTIKAQMNPHFIFNSLNSIQQFIMLRENEKAEIYLTKFSKLIRGLLESNAAENLTLAEELSILNGYLEMEALRFGGSFTYKVEVDEKLDLEKTWIPHMMIQPFVENAVWHGLLPKKSDASVSVCFEYLDERSVKCIIDDNGIGREAARQKKNTFKKKSLALSYVNQRLDLISKMGGGNYQVKIIDKMDTAGKSAGTQITVVLPIYHHPHAQSANH